MINEKRILNEFLEMVQIDSLSYKEADFAKVLIEKLEEIGCTVYVDDAGKNTGGETGNIIATLKGNKDGKKILFSSHMDTVTPGLGIKPIVDEAEGIIKSDGTTILGSDDKAGIAAILEALRYIKENNIDHTDIQVVLSMCEECGLVGAKNLDYSKIDADYAFVLDSGGSPGEIIVEAPSQDVIKVKIKGKTAHAGMEPENGISAIMVAARAIDNMTLLRIDENTTANIGMIKGGSATNIVTDLVEIDAEARSLSEEKLDVQTKHMVDTFKKAAEDYNAEVEINVDRVYPPLNVDVDSDIVKLAKKAFANMGIEAYTGASGGGSDTNILNRNGILAINLGVGMKNAHTLNEYIAIKDLYNSANMLIEIVKEI
ncbi:M20/M25/M40 family metallo-hydrolase [Clostridioides mangenotii]|uniref:M20/M25/M40 family metallo-hydrolase n=1 Tax=Metaclostridioides mangenotii TaxID=1540 RepID=UPI001C0F5E6B|nr:M20/M25/M40 family metallo-hydrolase [Clostridioides mangenotii]MBU5308445.1 M20/M25/M40 family metallo-hydrolase [Clostridioides mangenotii]MCR1955756.1 M20/M25/M40 family metallo-hydrolase [Clostridioides mangenotii]